MIKFLKSLFKRKKTNEDVRPEIETEVEPSQKKIHPQDRPDKKEKIVYGSGPIKTKFRGGFVLASHWYRPSRPDKAPAHRSEIWTREQAYLRWLREKKEREAKENNKVQR